jgi:hypothetical protein
MDALFFARVRHIGSASIYNNGVVWLDSVAATNFARSMGWTDCPSLHQSAQRQGRCNDPAVDVSLDKFGFDEHLNEGRHASDRRSSTRRRCPVGITNPPFPLIMGRREKSARPLALGATYENISTSMTGTKCITRAHKEVTKGSKGFTQGVRNAPKGRIVYGFVSCEGIIRPLMINFGQREG